MQLVILRALCHVLAQQHTITSQTFAKINLTEPFNQITMIYYLRCHLASGEGIVMLAVMLCVCPLSRLYHVSTAHRISLGGEGNAPYPVFCSLKTAFKG